MFPQTLTPPMSNRFIKTMKYSISFLIFESVALLFISMSLPGYEMNIIQLWTILTLVPFQLMLVSLAYLFKFPTRLELFSNRLELFHWRESEPRVTMYLSEIDNFGINGKTVIDSRGNVMELSYLSDEQLQLIRRSTYTGRSPDSIVTGHIVSKGPFKRAPTINVAFSRKPMGKIVGSCVMLVLSWCILAVGFLVLKEKDLVSFALIETLSVAFHISSLWSLFDLSNARKLTINSYGVSITKNGKDMLRFPWRELKKIMLGNNIHLKGHNGNGVISESHFDVYDRRVAFAALNTYATYYDIPVERGYGSA